MGAYRSRSPARAVALELLGLLSEVETIRESLLDAGAVSAFSGDALSQNAAWIIEINKNNSRTHAMNKNKNLQELFHCLFGMANLLESPPDYDDDVATVSSSSRNSKEESYTFRSVSKSLEEAVLQASTAQGISSLLKLASVPIEFRDIKFMARQDEVGIYDIMLETYRTLVSLCPLLLTPMSQDKGLLPLTRRILLQFCDVIVFCTESKGSDDAWEKLLLDSLNGLRPLVKYVPLRNLVIERSLSHIFQIINNVKEAPSLAKAANMVFSSMNFNSGAMEILGNDANALVDWWEFERGIDIQILSLDEVLWSVYMLWKDAFEQALDIVKRFGNNVGDSSAGKQYRFLKNYLKIKYDTDEVARRREVVQQYFLIYRNCQSEALEGQSFHPFYNTPWLLDHNEEVSQRECIKSEDLEHLIPERVQSALDFYLPSRAIQSDTLPIFHVSQNATFDFRTISMPKRSYFSFRKEGQILSRLCEDVAGGVGDKKSKSHFSISFVDSLFGGEFTETFVHALYRCPAVNAISFRTTQADTEEKTSNTQPESNRVKSPIPDLVGTLPPWVTHLTCDNTLCPTSLKKFFEVFEPLGQVISKNPQSSLQALSIKNCIPFPPECISCFSKILFRGGLPSLRVIDLSGNQLGDMICGELLADICKKETSSSVERLDLSGNNINEGSAVLKALNMATRDRIADRYSQTEGYKKRNLQHLDLSSNELSSHFVSDVLAMLENDALQMTSLNLSKNNISVISSPYLVDTITRSIARNSSLVELNLSGNQLDVAFLESLFETLRSVGMMSKLAFIRLENNIPAFDKRLISNLNELLKKGKKQYIESRFREKPQSSSENPIVSNRRLSRYSQQPFMRKQEEVEENSDAIVQVAEQSDTNFKNKLTVLFSAPLCCRLADNTFKPIDVLDFELERDLLFNCFREASQDIELEFDTATTERLSACLSKRCTCLHYSGHGHPSFLTFEDGKGGLHGVKVDHLKQSLVSGDGSAPFQFVFVSACHSKSAGQAFVDAGK